METADRTAATARSAVLVPLGEVIDPRHLGGCLLAQDRSSFDKDGSLYETFSVAVGFLMPLFLFARLYRRIVVPRHFMEINTTVWENMEKIGHSLSRLVRMPHNLSRYCVGFSDSHYMLCLFGGSEFPRFF